jgi:septum site-determining protein MinD
MSQVIGILSGKGGVGKTTVVANLGAALSDEFEKNVAILDSNISSSHLGLHFGMYEDPKTTLRDVMRKNMHVSYATYVHPQTGIRIVPAPLNGEGVNMTPSKLKGVTKKLADSYNMVLMDCSPGLGKEVITSIAAMDSALIVTTPDFPAVADALKTINLLEKMNKKISGIVVNRHSGEKFELTAREIESTCGVPVLAMIPEDKHVARSISEGVPVVVHAPHSKSSIAFKQLGGGLVGESYTPPSIIHRVLGAVAGRKKQHKIEESDRVYSSGGSPQSYIEKMKE